MFKLIGKIKTLNKNNYNFTRIIFFYTKKVIYYQFKNSIFKVNLEIFCLEIFRKKHNFKL